MTRLINHLLRKTWLPLSLQCVMLAAFALLVGGGLVVNTSDMAFAKVLRNTNLANLIVWSYWWPLIILSTIFFGRIWCALCPMELITSLAAKVGLKRRPPRILASGWIVVACYLLILVVGIHLLAIHRVPFRMALYLLFLLATALVSGLLFSRNTFCAHVCPVGFLLGFYARLAPLGWGVRDASICSECIDRSCISRKTAYDFQGRSCGVGLKPFHLMDNSACLLCGQCLKACDRNNPGLDGRPNPGWYRRRWFKDLLDLRGLSFAQVTFCLVVSGFVIYEVVTEWAVTRELLLWLPSQVEQALGAHSSVVHGLLKSALLFGLLPALLWALPFAAFRLVGGRLRLREYLLSFGIAYIPIMAAAHATKALLKMSSRLPYWKYVFHDPLGSETARGILDKTLTLAPLPSWRDPVITFLSLSLMAVGVGLSCVVVHRLIAARTREAGWRAATLYLIPILYGGLFSAMLFAWHLRLFS